MYRRIGAGLRLASSLLVLSGFLALATVRLYGSQVLLVPFVVLPLAPILERIDARFPVYRTVTWPISLAYFCFIPFTISELGLIDAVVALVVFIQVYTLAHQKGVRHFYHLFLMALFMLLAACVQAPEPEIAVVLVFFLVGSVWSFVLLRFHAESADVSDAAQIVLIDSREAVAESPPRPRWDWRISMSTGGICLAVLLLMIVFFIATPRMEAGFLGRELLPERTRTGLPERVDLSGGGTVAQDSTAVMHVEFPDLPRGLFRGSMYWRTTTLTQYVGSSWTRRGLFENGEFEVEIRARRRGSGFVSSPRADRIERKALPGKTRVRQVVYMDEVPYQGVPCLDLVLAAGLIGSPRGATLHWDEYEDFTILLETTGSRHMNYEVISEVGEASPELLRAAPSDYENTLEPRDFQLLTANDLQPATQELVRRITQEADNPYDRAVVLQQWLSGPDFSYTLDLPVLPRDNAIDMFIMETRRGHCELFASALALMLRSLGIPTRVVSGFRGGEYDEDNQAYTVRASDAHLWVEVLFSGCGWVVFDPSPRTEDTELGQLDQISRAMSRLTLEAKMFWYRNVIGFDRTFSFDQLRVFARSSLGLIPSLTDPVGLPLAGRGWQAPAGVLLFAFLGGLAVLLTLSRMQGERLRYTLTPDQWRARRFYRGMLRMGKRAGLRIQGLTAEEFLSALSGTATFDAKRASTLIRQYNDVRFGGRSLSIPEYRELRRALRELRRHRTAATQAGVSGEGEG